MKACPFCAEEIQDAAIVCKHCGRDLVATTPTPALNTSRVTVVDFDMPFGSMVVMILKWSLAAIPAAAILLMIAMMVGVVIGIAGGAASTASLFRQRTDNPSAADLAQQASASQALVVNVRQIATGWRITNDNSTARAACVLTIEGHRVNIPTLAGRQSLELPSSAFSDGGIPNATEVTRDGVSMTCESPERRNATIYLFQ